MLGSWLNTKTMGLGGVLSLGLLLTACGSGLNKATSTASTLPSDVKAKIPADLSVVFPNSKQAGANTNDCNMQLLNKTVPTVPAKLAKNSYPLCFNGFNVLYSGISKTPIWVAEYLTKQRLTDAKLMPREGSFYEETQLPKAVRSRLADYTNSGYDRGHLAPNADMQNALQQKDSFTLANIAPQVPDHNRKTWVKVENKTRDLTNQYGVAYVVTGTAFLSSTVKTIGSNVLVPSHFYKAVYIPSKNKAVVFYSPNNKTGQIQQISLNELKTLTGVEVFPALPQTVKNTVMTVSLLP